MHCWWKCKLVQPLWKTVRRVFKELKIKLAYDPAIALLGISSKKTKTLTRKGICAPMFISALFTIAKIWKQPKCLLIGEWIKKMWYIYTMTYYSDIRKNDILPFATTWMDLEGIMLSEISQTEIVKVSHDLTYMWNLKTNKQIKQSQTHGYREKTKQVVTRREGSRRL